MSASVLADLDRWSRLAARDFETEDEDPKVAARRAKNRRAHAVRVANYRAGRLALVQRLGGVCAQCKRVKNPDLLEFDHLAARTWKANRLGRWQRLEEYKRDASAGKIQLLCRRCNAKKGKPGRGSR